MEGKLKDVLTIRVERPNGEYVEQRLVADGGLRLNDDLYDVFRNTLICVGFDQESIDAFFGEPQ